MSLRFLYRQSSRSYKRWAPQYYGLHTLYESRVEAIVMHSLSRENRGAASSVADGHKSPSAYWKGTSNGIRHSTSIPGFFAITRDVSCCEFKALVGTRHRYAKSCCCKSRCLLSIHIDFRCELSLRRLYCDRMWPPAQNSFHIPSEALFTDVSVNPYVDIEQLLRLMLQQYAASRPGGFPSWATLAAADKLPLLLRSGKCSFGAVEKW